MTRQLLPRRRVPAVAPLDAALELAEENRALRASGDFDDYWQFHLAKKHERTHVTLR